MLDAEKLIEGIKEAFAKAGVDVEAVKMFTGKDLRDALKVSPKELDKILGKAKIDRKKRGEEFYSSVKLFTHQQERLDDLKKMLGLAREIMVGTCAPVKESQRCERLALQHLDEAMFWMSRGISVEREGVLEILPDLTKDCPGTAALVCMKYAVEYPQYLKDALSKERNSDCEKQNSYEGTKH